MTGTLDRVPVHMPLKPVCIWRLGVADNFWVKDEFEMYSNLGAINYWQKAQRGLFTRLTHQDHSDIVTYLTERKLDNGLHRFIIPGSETGKALSDLEAMNITFATLFPDLRGAALQANVASVWRFLGAD